MVNRKKSITLNQKSIAGIKPNGKRQLFHDGNYLYLSVSIKGAKSFYFRGYRFNGKVINEFSLGTYRVNDKDNSGDLTLSEAREKTREIIRTYRQGIDYHQQQKQAKAKKLRTDNEIIFTSFVFRTFLKLVNIQHQRIPTASPWCNGRIE